MSAGGERPAIAVQVDRPGSYEQLRVIRTEPRRPEATEVRLRVAAAGVNYADCVVRMGLYSSAKRYVGWPITPGFEVAGVVDAVGESVDGFALGDRVLAVTRFGGYASHVIVPTRQVFALPPERSFEEAAALPAVFLTAWYGLLELARPRAGQRVLVHSAAGGVGGALVQLGVHIGCEVTGVVGAPHKLEAVRALGAAHVIDKSTEDLWTRARRVAPDGFDVVLDANGVSTLKESYRHLRRPGKLVVYGFASMLPRADERLSWPRLAFDWLRTPRFDPMAMTGDCRSVLAFNLSYLFDEVALFTEGMEVLLDLWRRGDVRAPAITTFPVRDVAAAHRALEGGQTVGKLVLTFD